jgi:hypothetical protein
MAWPQKRAALGSRFLSRLLLPASPGCLVELDKASVFVPARLR